MKNNFIKLTALAGMVIGLSTTKVMAEGTKELSPDNNNITALAILQGRGSGPYVGAPDQNKIRIMIKDVGETIYYGFNWRHYAGGTGIAAGADINNRMFVVIKDPDGSIVVDQRLGGTTGVISNLSEAQAGPKIGGSPAGGYTPRSYVTTKAGEYTIEFKRSTNTSGSFTAVASSVWSQCPYFDITVKDTDGETQNGRLFSQYWGFVATDNAFTIAADKTAAPVFYSYSTDETIIQLSFGADGFKPIAFDVAFTDYGVDPSVIDWLVGRKSISTVSAPSLTNGYKVFVNIPDEDLFPVTPMPADITFAQQAITGCPGEPMEVHFIMPESGDARLLFDIDGNPGFDEGTEDFVLEAINLPAGPNSIPWDGKDGLGNPVVSGTEMSISATYRRGRFNLPLFDAEINKNGLHLKTIAPLLKDSNRLYWDDTDLVQETGSCPSDGSKNLTPAGYNFSADGVLSSPDAYARSWNGNGNPGNIIPAPEVSGNESNNSQCDDYGNVRVLNTWGWALEQTSDPIVFYFGCFDISGNVYNDVNGLSDSLVNLSGDDVLPTDPLYVYLVNQFGNIIEKTTVAADGTYSFSQIKGGEYTLVLSDVDEAVGEPVPVASLPEGWVNMGEQVGAVAGTNVDTLTDGEHKIVLNQDMTNVNFGIQEAPTADDNTLATQPNPGGTNTFTIPDGSFLTDDTNGGTVTGITIVDFPSNITSITIGDTTYYASSGDIPSTCPTAACAEFPTDGVTVPLDVDGNPTIDVKIDPIDGTVDVEIPYIAVDDGKATSDSDDPAILNIPFNSFTISGNVYNDVNGLTDNLVNLSGDDVLPTETLYVYLIDSDNNIIGKTTLAADGTYSFTGLGQGTYDLVLTTEDADLGDPKPTATLPGDWENMGEQTGTTAGVNVDSNPDGTQSVTVSTADVTEVNFGIQEAPTADDKTLGLNENPGGTNTIDIPDGSFITGDTNGGEVISITLTEFPSNTTSISVGDTTYYPTSGDIPGVCPTDYCAVFPADGITIDLDAAGDPVEPIAVDPIDGRIVVEIPFVANDDGSLSSDPASVILPFAPLNVSLLDFQVEAQGSNAYLTWTTASEKNNRGFEILHSLDGKDWNNKGFVSSKAKEGNSHTSITYSFLDKETSLGVNYYRLKQNDRDGSYTYSVIRQLTIDMSSQLSIHPNPTTSYVTVEGLSGTETIYVYDIQGKKLAEYTAESSILNVDLSNYANGVYTIQIVNNRNVVSEKVIKK